MILPKGKVTFWKFYMGHFWYKSEQGDEFWLTQDEAIKAKKLPLTAPAFSHFIQRSKERPCPTTSGAGCKT